MCVADAGVLILRHVDGERFRELLSVSWTHPDGVLGSQIPDCKASRFFQPILKVNFFGSPSG